MANVVALVFGILYALGGVIGFVIQPNGLLFTIFAVNPYHHVFHIVLGGLGVVAGWQKRGLLYCQVAGIVLILLAILGFVAPDLVSQLIGHPPDGVLTDNLLHIITGVGLAYFGLLARPVAEPQKT